MNIFITCFSIIYAALVVLCTYTTYINIKHTKYKYKYAWPVQHRLDNNGFIQYSVDGKTWTNLIKFVNGKNGPELNYMHYDNDSSDYINICNILKTMQLCHQWNKNEFRKYKSSITEYLNK